MVHWSVLPTQHCASDKIKKKEMGGAWGRVEARTVQGFGRET